MPVSERLCEAVDLRSSWTVLDAATGAGNTALAVARHGCQVVAVDIAPGLLDRAEQRARAERLPVDFRLADVEDLPFANESFDAVVSTFGLPFASDARVAVDEVVRVCRPDGTLGLTAWAPGGPNAVEEAVFAKYLGDDDPPSPWATADGIEDLLAPAVDSMWIYEREITFRFASVEAYVDTTLETFGPLVAVYRELTETNQAGLCQDYVEGLSTVNQSSDETMVIPFPYFEIVARV